MAKQDNISTTYDPKNITSGIPLLPFTNQVGGHTSIFRFSKRAICKPASPKEQQVYVYLESHHPELLPFLSQYLGVLNVTYHHLLLPEVIFEKNESLLNEWKNIGALLPSPSPEDRLDEKEEEEKDFQQWSPNPDECNSRYNAFKKRVLHEALNPNALKERMQKVQDAWNKNNYNMTIMTSKIPSIITSTTSAPPSTTRLLPAEQPPLHIRTNSSIIPSSNTEEETKVTYSSSPLISRQNSMTEEEIVAAATPSTNNKAHWQPRRAPTNPWSQQVYERDYQKLLLQQSKDDVVKQFILLEDLTDSIEYPCVLDLKMGIRQHGVDSSESKTLSQTSKCSSSTSSALGVRVCGMQVYHQDKFTFFDKYKGRSLTADSFKSTLRDYFNDEMVLDQIPVLLRKLNRLSKIVSSLKRYRFYGSSLLVIYDGGGGKGKGSKKIDVRMIDFAKSVTPQDYEQKQEWTYPPEKEDEPDHGYLLGLKSLIQSFNDIYNEHCQSRKKKEAKD
jgi:hypothetical protein